MFSYLEDLDFADDLVDDFADDLVDDLADDLAEIEGNNTHLQEKTERLNNFANQTGLTCNVSAKQEGKVMTINAPAEPIFPNGEPLEEVEDFTCRIREYFK